MPGLVTRTMPVFSFLEARCSFGLAPGLLGFSRKSGSLPSTKVMLWQGVESVLERRQTDCP